MTAREVHADAQLGRTLLTKLDSCPKLLLNGCGCCGALRLRTLLIVHQEQIVGAAIVEVNDRVLEKQIVVAGVRPTEYLVARKVLELDLPG